MAARRETVCSINRDHPGWSAHDGGGFLQMQGPAKVMQCPEWEVCCRPVTQAAQIESWGALGEKGDAADALMEGRKSMKYSKADVVWPACSAKLNYIKAVGSMPYVVLLQLTLLACEIKHCAWPTKLYGIGVEFCPCLPTAAEACRK